MNLEIAMEILTRAEEHEIESSKMQLAQLAIDLTRERHFLALDFCLELLKLEGQAYIKNMVQRVFELTPNAEFYGQRALELLARSEDCERSPLWFLLVRTSLIHHPRFRKMIVKMVSRENPFFLQVVMKSQDKELIHLVHLQLRGVV